MFTFPLEKIKEPIIYELVKKFDLIPNIRRADINDSYSWMILEIEGPKTTIPYHQKIMENGDFISGKFDTGFLENFNYKPE